MLSQKVTHRTHTPEANLFVPASAFSYLTIQKTKFLWISEQKFSYLTLETKPNQNVHMTTIKFDFFCSLNPNMTKNVRECLLPLHVLDHHPCSEHSDLPECETNPRSTRNAGASTPNPWKRPPETRLNDRCWTRCSTRFHGPAFSHLKTSEYVARTGRWVPATALVLAWEAPAELSPVLIPR